MVTTRNQFFVTAILMIAIIGETLSIFQMPVTKIESQRSKDIRMGLKPRKKWLSFTAGPYKSIVNDYYDLAYLGTTYMGSQNTPFNVVLDTGSADYWIPDISCGICDYYCHGIPLSFCQKLCDKGCCSVKSTFTKSKCANKQTFNAAKSNTYQEQNGTWRIYYGTGMAAGYRGKDKINLGGMVFDVRFGQATMLDPFMLRNSMLNGILGLAFQALSVDDTPPPFIEAVNQKIIKDAVFTVYLKRVGYKESKDGGVYTFGGVDNENCDENIDYVPLSSATYFQFIMDRVMVGTKTISGTADVISDTGTSFIGAPEYFASEIAKEIGAKEGQYGYELPCNHGPLPNITLTIGGKNYIITSENYVVQMDDDYCELAITPLPYMGIGPQWILGDPFIREYCNIHDMGRQRIGFAKPKRK